MKTVAFLFVAVLTILFLIGWTVSWELVPVKSIANLPGWVRIIGAVAAILFGVAILAGYVADSGVVKRIFKK